MLCFDKLMIKTSINNISDIGDDFVASIKNDVIISHRYKQEMPLLKIRLEHGHDELIIEFTSKLLGDDMIYLINQSNIRQCLDNINALGCCHLAVDAILNEAEVLRCDVTRDVLCSDISKISNYVATHIKNNKKWVCKQYQQNGVVLENVVSTARCKKRLTIYDKHKELSKSRNRDYLNGLSAKSAVEDFYKDKIRFELNLNSKEQIRKNLNVEETTLVKVLAACGNPILNILDEVLCQPVSCEEVQGLSLRDYERLAFLREHDNDLQKVEMKVRSLVSCNTSINKTMKPYRELLGRLNQNISVISFPALLKEPA